MSDYVEDSDLLDRPLGDLALAVRFRRRLIKAGFETFGDLVSCGEDGLARRLAEDDDIDAVLRLRERFREGDPALAGDLAKPGRDVRAPAPEPADGGSARKPVPASGATAAAGPAPAAPSAPRRDGTAQRGGSALRAEADPPQGLSGFQARARVEIGRISAEGDGGLAYRAFDAFAMDSVDLARAFLAFFDRNRDDQRYAIRTAAAVYGDAFIVFTAMRAAEKFEGRNLWDPFFGDLGISDANIQADYKRAFVDALAERGMPVFEREEQGNRYYYTALLHGGLSRGLWKGLWSSLLALARGGRKSRRRAGGYSILSRIAEGGVGIKATAGNVLGKLPPEMLAPLLESAADVAAQVVAGDDDAGDAVVSSCGLPDAAMRGLQDALAGPSAGGGRERGLVYLRQPSMVLDLDAGRVVIRWGGQQLPLRFSGAVVEYRLDGELGCTREVEEGVGKCLLGQAEIAVGKRHRYTAQVRMTRPDGSSGDGGEAEETGRLSRTFRPGTSGCFEFLRDREGVYRLRGDGDRIARRRRIAYLVENACRLEPGPGMVPVEAADGPDGWDGARILVYDVDPGASGRIVDGATGKVVSAWHEGYISSIDRNASIGRASDGTDLYGVAPHGESARPGGLPRIEISSSGDGRLAGDLDITCVCDGRELDVGPAIDRMPAADPGRHVVVFAPPPDLLPSTHIARCEVAVRERSGSGALVCSYRFGVLPVAGLGLADVSFDSGPAIAVYRLYAADPVTVADAQDRRAEVARGGVYEVRTLLSDGSVSLGFETADGTATAAELYLAAIDVRFSVRLADIERYRPICLADAIGSGRSAGTVSFESAAEAGYGVVGFQLGGYPPEQWVVSEPKSRSCDIFRDCGLFVPDGAPEDIPLKVRIRYRWGYGPPDDVWVEDEILRCREGIGFGGVRVGRGPAGATTVAVAGAFACSARIDFLDRRGMVLGSAVAEAGDTEVLVPSGRVYGCVRNGQRVRAKVVPAGGFGKFREDLAFGVAVFRKED